MSIYNLDWLIQEVKKEQKIKYLFFWGHRPKQDGHIGQSCLSQWWPCTFEVENDRYQSAEHWMMAQKAKLFDDEEIRQQILETSSPAKAKKLGRNVKNFDSDIWNKKAFDIVVEGNFHKFDQNKNLLAFLLSSSPKVLVEASPVDEIWGIGLAKDEPNSANPSLWKGQNLLGFALMEARKQLLKKGLV